MTRVLPDCPSSSRLSSSASLPSPARDWLDKGVQAFQNVDYPQAIAAFENAVRLSPDWPTAHQSLAAAWMAKWIPGLDSPENLDAATHARTGFVAVLGFDARNEVALRLAGVAGLQRGQQHPGSRREAAKIGRSPGLNPRRQDAHYSLGVIAWAKCYPALITARQKLGMKPEDPGPLPDAAAPAELNARYGLVLADGIARLNQALEIDPDFDDAIAYLNLPFRPGNWSGEQTPYARPEASRKSYCWRPRSMQAARLTPSN